MANAVGMKMYLRDVIGLADPLERGGRRLGLKALELSRISRSSKRRILRLSVYSSVRKPDRTIPNPNAGAPGAPENIPTLDTPYPQSMRNA